MLYNHDDLYHNSTDTNSSDTNSLLTSNFISSTRGERHNSEKFFVIILYLPQPKCSAHLVVFKISVCRDLKNPTTSFNSSASMTETQPSGYNLNLNSVFLKSSNYHPISSGHDIIHPHSGFISCLGFIMTMMILISFARQHKTVPIDSTPGLLTWIVQSPAKLKNRI